MAERKSVRQKIRRCKCCAGILPKTNIAFCDACREAGMGSWNDKSNIATKELLLVAKQRNDNGMNPIEGMNMGQISLLARCFKAPYSTYGRFRGYVEMTGRLPPKEFWSE